MNENDLKKRVEELYKPETSIKNLLDFFKEIISGIDNNEISLQVGSYYIAEFIRHPKSDKDSKLEDITTIAGSLEIPSDSKAAVPDPQHEYSILKKLILSY